MSNNKSHLLLPIALIILFFGGFFILTGPQFTSAAPSGTNEAFVYLPTIRKPTLPTTFGMDIGSVTEVKLNNLAPAKPYFFRRGSLIWADVEPNEGNRNWGAVAQYENDMILATSKGKRLILIVTKTPTWAQQWPGLFCGPIKDSKLASFANFMHDLVARYSVPPYNVLHYEIWNEPDAPAALVDPEEGFGCWGDTSDPYNGGRQYGKMLKAIYPQVKAANPLAQVVFGGLLLDCDPNNPPAGRTCVESKFLEGALVAGAGPYFDGISFHAYDFYAHELGKYGNFDNWNSISDTTGPVPIAKAQFLRSVLASYGVIGKYLMNTESALICGGPFDPPGQGFCDDDPNSVFEQTKAYYLAEAYAVGIAEGFNANVWYSMFGWRNSSLFYSGFVPRPAFNAYVQARATLQDSVSLGKITTYPNVFGYEFHRGDRRIWVLWSQDRNPHTISLPGTPLAAYDLYGNPESFTGNTLTVTVKPLYIEWSP
jgi:hypothetical protein